MTQPPWLGCVVFVKTPTITPNLKSKTILTFQIPRNQCEKKKHKVKIFLYQLTSQNQVLPIANRTTGYIINQCRPPPMSIITSFVTLPGEQSASAVGALDAGTGFETPQSTRINTAMVALCSVAANVAHSGPVLAWAPRPAIAMCWVCRSDPWHSEASHHHCEQPGISDLT